MVIKCKNCGRDLRFKPGDACSICEFCNTVNTIPQGNDEQKQDLYNRTSHSRQQGESDQALAAYGRLLEQDKKVTAAVKRKHVIISVIRVAIIIIAVILVAMRWTAREAKIKPYKTIGGVVTFGTYRQTASGTDRTPIEWIVLDVQGNKALLLSKYGLDSKPYNTKSMDITWEDCTLRAWLNNGFQYRAFSTNERKAILTTDVINSTNQVYSGWNTSGGNNTQDKIFLMSYAEANKYLGAAWKESSNTKPRSAPTAYAIRQGAYASDSSKTAEGQSAGRWWLRSPGDIQRNAAYVNDDGSLSCGFVCFGAGVVRPAMWINLESGIFYL